MPYRRLLFVNDEIYHVVNRGVANAPIFFNRREYQRFIDLLEYYRFDQPPLCFSHYNRLLNEERRRFLNSLINKSDLVEILAYCLMPNHFHLLIKQKGENGIKKMLSNMENGYARFLNLRHNRLGPLFQSVFKAGRIENEEQLLHVQRYIHLNPSSSFLVNIPQLPSYEWSSLPEYLGKRKNIFVSTDLILSLTGGPKNFEKFVFDQAEYQQKLDQIKHLTLEKS